MLANIKIRIIELASTLDCNFELVHIMFPHIINAHIDNRNRMPSSGTQIAKRAITVLSIELQLFITLQSE